METATITAQIVSFKITVFFIPLIIAGFVLRAAFPARENPRTVNDYQCRRCDGGHTYGEGR